MLKKKVNAVKHVCLFLAPTEQESTLKDTERFLMAWYCMTSQTPPMDDVCLSTIQSLI